jgi:hypothetical protein
MRIVLEQEGGTYYATAYGEELNEYIHEELLYAEVSPSLGAWMVRWESDYFNPQHFDTFDLARKYVLTNYFNYTPLSRGTKHYVG